MKTTKGTLRRRSKISFIFFFCSFSIWAIEPSPQVSTDSPRTLKETIERTIQTHPLIRFRKAGISVADHNVSEQRATYWPTVDAVFGTGTEWSNNATTRARRGDNELDRLSRDEGTLTLTQRIFDGFDTRNRVRAAKARYDSAEKSLGGEGENLGLRVVEVYLNVLRQRELVKITEESVLVHQEISDRIKRREEAGYDKKSDVYQVQARLSLAKTRLNNQKGVLSESVSSFHEVVGVEPAELESPTFQEEWLQYSLEEILHFALEENPDIQAATATTKARKLDVKAVQAVFFPLLQLELSGSENQDLNGVKGQDDSYIAALRLRYNLFRGGADIERKRKAVETYFQEQAQESEIKRRLREDIRKTWTAISVARDQVVEEKKHLETAELLREAYHKQFQIGARPLLALLDAEDERALAKASLKTQEYRLLFEQYRLLSQIGRLLKSLTVHLPPLKKGD